MGINLKFNLLHQGFEQYNIDDDFFYEMFIDFVDYCGTQGVEFFQLEFQKLYIDELKNHGIFMKHNIFQFRFVRDYLKEIQDDKIQFSFKTYKVRIIHNNEMKVIQFPRFKTVSQFYKYLKNYYITELYFNKINISWKQK